MIISGPLASGTKTAIAGTALQLTATSQKLVNGIFIQTPSGNTAPIYIGVYGVTTATGFAIAAGATSPLIPVTDPSTIYAISTGGSQSLVWIGS